MDVSQIICLHCRQIYGVHYFYPETIKVDFEVCYRLLCGCQHPAACQGFWLIVLCCNQFLWPYLRTLQYLESAGLLCGLQYILSPKSMPWSMPLYLRQQWATQFCLLYQALYRSDLLLGILLRSHLKSSACRDATRRRRKGYSLCAVVLGDVGLFGCSTTHPPSPLFLSFLVGLSDREEMEGGSPAQSCIASMQGTRTCMAHTQAEWTLLTTISN